MTVALRAVDSFPQAVQTHELELGAQKWYAKAILAHGHEMVTNGVQNANVGPTSVGFNTPDGSQVAELGFAKFPTAAFDHSGSLGLSGAQTGNSFYGTLESIVGFSAFNNTLSGFQCGHVNLANGGGGTSSLLAGMHFFGGDTLQTSSGSFVNSGGAGNISVTGLGFQPQLVLFTFFGQNYFGDPQVTFGDHSAICIGASDGSSQWCASTKGAIYLSGVGHRNSVFSSSHVVVDMDRLVNTTFVSMNGDGFTVNFDGATDAIHMYMAFGDVGGNFAVGVGSAGDGSISPGFEAETIFTANCGTTTNDVILPGGSMGTGSAGNDDSLRQWAGWGAGSSATLNSQKYWNTSAIACSIPVNSGAPAQDAEASVTGFGATSVSLNWTSGGGTGIKFGWVAFKTSDSTDVCPTGCTETYSDVYPDTPTISGSADFKPQVLFAFGADTQDYSSAFYGPPPTSRAGFGFQTLSDGGGGAVGSGDHLTGGVEDGGHAIVDGNFSLFQTVSSPRTTDLTLASARCGDDPGWVWITGPDYISQLISGLLIGGSSVQTATGSFNLRTSTGTISPINVGFQPDIIFFLWGNYSAFGADPAVTKTGGASFGFGAVGGDVASMYSQSPYLGNPATGASSFFSTTSSVVVCNAAAATAKVQATITSTGATLTQVTGGDANQRLVRWIALRSVDNPIYFIQTTSRSSKGVQTISANNVEAILTVHANTNGSDTLVTGRAAFGIGVADQSNEISMLSGYPYGNRINNSTVQMATISGGVPIIENEAFVYDFNPTIGGAVRLSWNTAVATRPMMVFLFTSGSSNCNYRCNASGGGIYRRTFKYG